MVMGILVIVTDDDFKRRADRTMKLRPPENLGWPESIALRAEFLRVMRKLERLKKSFVLGRIRPKYMFRREHPKIHVWWGGLERNGDLLLLLAHLLNSNAEWRGASVEVMSIASSELMKTRTETYLGQLIPEIRIEAEVRVVLKAKDESVSETIHRESADAAAVFLGLQVPEIGEEETYAERIERLAGDLPVVFFVKNSSLFAGELLEATEAVTEDEQENEIGEDTADERASRDTLPLPE